MYFFLWGFCFVWDCWCLIDHKTSPFISYRNLQQWRDLAFCLSLLNYSEKAIKKLIENFSFYANTLRDEQVYYSFDAVISKSKKFAKPELKVIIYYFL